jgi:DNA-binding transcriptional ArsR family regulator
MPRKPRAAGAPPLAPSVAELRALAHPLRIRLLELFAEGPRTTKQVAELLGEPPTRLYHHIAALERAGLLELRETRKVRGTTERWYAAVARAYGSGAGGEAAALGDRGPGRGGRKRGPASKAAHAVALTVVEQARRELAAVAATRGSGERSADDAPLVARLVVNVPPERIPELRQRIYAAARDVLRELAPHDEATDGDGRARWALTLALAPVWPRGNAAR